MTRHRNLKLKLMYAAPFPVVAAVLSFLFLSISIGAVSYFLSVSADRENDVAFRESQHIVETAFSLAQRDVSNWVKDYAWWDDTVLKASNNVDIEWAEDNIGTYMQESFGITGSFIVSPTLETIFHSPRSENANDDAIAFLGVTGRDFLGSVQSTSMDKSIPLTTYTWFKNDLYLVGAAAITKEHPTAAELVPRLRSVLILYKKLDREQIDEMSALFLLRDLQVTVEAPQGASACIPMYDNGGNVISYISWTPGKPGDQLFMELLPKISLVSILLFIMALLVFFAWWRTASQANEEKSRFLAKMSHELRTPLNPIIGFSSLMSNETLGPLPDTYKGYADDIHQCGVHLSAIIEDILDVSRIESGEMTLNEQVFDIAELIENLPAFSNRATGHDAVDSSTPEIRKEIAENMPQLRADKLRIQQVLMNLLSNAMKFSEGKEIVIRANKESDHIIICVEDQGVGISEHDMNLLFQPFVQVGQQSIENRSHGSGLGLLVSRELMRLHHGELSLESEPGKGTTAIMKFPANRSA